MTPDRVRELLERINAIGDATDLDLLLFSFRHPTALLTIEQLAAAAGHSLERVEASLNSLIDAGLMERTTNPSLPVHIFAFGPPEDDAVISLLQIASSRPGRLLVLAALRQRANTPPYQRKA